MMKYGGNLEPLMIPDSATLEEIRDDQLKSAYTQSAECGSILPLIKQELKFKIQAKRLSEGVPELRVSFTEAPKYPLSKEELVKRETRKKNNRISARKCRLKRKIEIKSINQEMKDLINQNETLKRKVHHMEFTKTKLTQQVSNFLSSKTSTAGAASQQGMQLAPPGYLVPPLACWGSVDA
ncbi:hypothetical protein FSP39_005984 [Pinctada imbricata]|uniref:BZIP domain-containing protein n=1 Tax=Pinctada imbricata TaxID=66713 RepID=A0AA88Y568_PINIB|nr:hypothetical protein FSP39_005984 [Pinctada imbricata]